MSAANQVGGNTPEISLPQMRQDVELLEGWPEHGGAPTWMLFDPIRNLYFRVGHDVFQMLSVWGDATISQVQRVLFSRFQRTASDDDVSEVVKFLFANQLTVDPPEEGFRHFLKQEEDRKKSWFTRALHNYLFFRIPLFRPARFLEWSWPVVAPLFSKTAAVLFVLFGILSLYLVSRQWDAFQGQFIAFLSLEGLLYYGASLNVVKIIHELGHAWMATRYGLEVPVIGIAFLVLFPVLYTDTSNAWRLRSRRQRLLIDGAGIMVELALAVAATIGWVFLPDGPLRAVIFSVAAVSWIMSLLINLNPFMRFDGYYILSDLMGFENMQGRGFALAKWRLRELLFGLGVEKPEHLPRWLERTAILHAWGTWIYRFFLFLGIAFLIYTFFIKAVAIFLFVVEILWFIALPIWREVKEWWLMRDAISISRRGRWTVGIFAALVAASCLPLSAKVEVPAVMQAADETIVYPPMPARLEELVARQGKSVKAGDILARFSSDQLSLDINLTEKRIALLKQRIGRGIADIQDNAERRVLISQLSTETDTLVGHRKREADLVLLAPVSGVIVDLPPEVHVKRTLKRDFPLFGIRTRSGGKLSGLVAEEQLDRLETGAKGVFVPDNAQLASVAVRLTGEGQTAINQLRDTELAEVYGGKVPAKASTESGLTPIGSFYSVSLLPEETSNLSYGQAIRGVVLLEGERRSFAGRIARRVASVLIRESGF